MPTRYACRQVRGWYRTDFVEQVAQMAFPQVCPALSVVPKALPLQVFHQDARFLHVDTPALSRELVRQAHSQF